MTYDQGEGPLASLRIRYFGPRALIEDNTQRSDSTTLLEAALGWRWKRTVAQIEAFNLLNSKDHDIDYYYASRLQGEAAGGVNDIHYHPVEPFTLRGTVTWTF